MGKEVLDFPTLSYLPQYLSLFVVGIVAYRRDWFRTIPGSMGVVGFVTALVATILLFPLAFSGSLVFFRAFRASGFCGQRDLGVGGICALGFHLRSRHDPGRDHILPPLFQRGEKPGYIPFSTELRCLYHPCSNRSFYRHIALKGIQLWPRCSNSAWRRLSQSRLASLSPTSSAKYLVCRGFSKLMPSGLPVLGGLAVLSRLKECGQ